MEQQSTNTFLKSKMNKDLDERLVPSGEYRDAVNIAISKSESSNVGAAENVQGNERLPEGMFIGKQLHELVDGDPLVIIGQLVHEASGYIYLFLTNQDRADIEVITKPQYFDVARQHWVVRWSINSNSIDIYAGGPFLNFSTYFPINNVNLLETQLYWTDNFNQPRSLDVTRFIPYASPDLPHPLPNYEILPYYKEDQISACTYSPYKAIQAYKDIGAGDLVTTLQNATSSNLPYVAMVDIDHTLLAVDNEMEITPPTCTSGPAIPLAWVGLQCWTSDNQITPSDHAYISAVAVNDLTILYRDGSTPAVSYTGSYVAGDAQLYVGQLNPNWQEDSGVTTYPGDQTFLEDKFVRFSYRFKYRNGTYSTIAPYTQECFIPKQYGYFLDGDEKASYESTVVSFMENMVNRILLQIIMPEDEAGAIIHVNEMLNKLNVSEIDIIYKESESAALKVVQTISQNLLTSYWLEETPNATVLASTTFDILMSLVPGVLKHQRELLRPGARITSDAWGGFVTITNVVEASPVFNITVTPAEDWTIGDVLTITQPVYEFDYQNNEPYKTLPADQLTRVYDKVPVKALTQEIISNRITYANFQDKHTPPTAIDYQVGVSSKFNPGGTYPDGGSYAYYSYPNHTVKQNRNYQVGFVLSDRYGRSSSVILSSRPNETITIGDSDFGADTIYHPYKTLDDFGGQIEGFDNVLDWPGDSIKVLVNDIITSEKNNSGSPGLYNGDVTSEDYNPLGWYSYKVVVKQKEQEYYNVYLPYIVNGLAQDFGSDPAAGPTANPDIPATFVENSINEQASIVLINDNINKVPRDLTEVGPDQEQFRSSVRMWGRVTPELPISAPFVPVYWDEMTCNEQYYPDIVSDVVSTIASQNELYSGFSYAPSFLPDLVGGATVYNYKPGTEFPAIYNSATNPLVATITTEKAIGASGLTNQGSAIGVDAWPYTFSVYETEPVESRLDIYWETSTTGLIADLNTEIIENVIGVASAIDNLVINFHEDRDYTFAYILGTAAPYYSQADIASHPITNNPNGPIITSDFNFVDDLGAAVNTVEINWNTNIQWTAQDVNGLDVRYSPSNPNGIFDIRRIPAGDQLANYEFTGVPETRAYDTFVVTVNSNSVFLLNPNIREFSFELPVRSQNASLEWITEVVTFQIDLDNVAPQWETLPIDPTLITFLTNCFAPPGGPCDSSTRPQLRANNGTGSWNTLTQYEQIKYEIVSVVKNGQSLGADTIFELQPSITPNTMEARIINNNGVYVSGLYTVVIRAYDCDGSSVGEYTDQTHGWQFGVAPINCEFLMETVENPTSPIIPTLNPFDFQGGDDVAPSPFAISDPCQSLEEYCNTGIARGSDGAMIIWTSKYQGVLDPEPYAPWNYGILPNNQLPINSNFAGTGSCDSQFPAGIPVPYVWLWEGSSNNPPCGTIVNPSSGAKCVQGPNRFGTAACCPLKDISFTNSLDMSYGPSWCNSGPSGITEGTGFITITYTQVLHDNQVSGNGGLTDEGISNILSNFKVYLQYRRETPVTTGDWSDSPQGIITSAIPYCRDIENTHINSTDLANPAGLLSGNWKVSQAPEFDLNGGVLYNDVDAPAPLPGNPYPIPYWELGDPDPTNQWSTSSQIQSVAVQDQYTIQVSRTIAINDPGGYRLLISALRGTLTQLTAAQDLASGCTYQYTNNNGCLIHVKYGDFYYPNNATNVAWKYLVSVDGSANQLAAQNYNGPMAQKYAREPFFRYVTQFYDDPQLTIPWVPNVAPNPWFMYRYWDTSPMPITPGEDGHPLGNDNASYSINDINFENQVNSIEDRRWICQLNIIGNKTGRSFATAKQVT